MFYKMIYDMDTVDELMDKGESFIYAEDDNLDDIVYEGIKKGHFNTIILKNLTIEEWPKVEFYYSSKASNIESDFLLNVSRWPLVHLDVKTVFEENDIKGISFYDVKLIDVVTSHVNNDYYLLFVNNFIDAYDMNKSEYRYNEKYDMYTFAPNKIYLNVEKCRQYDIFRCNQSPAMVYVSQKIVNLIQQHSFTGFSFIPQN